MYDTNGPVWYRGWALDDEEKVCAQIESVLARTGTRRMIMGHTPDFNVCIIHILLAQPANGENSEYRVKM